MSNLTTKYSVVTVVLLCFFLGCKPVAAQQIAYTNGKDSWNPDSLGNHRAVVMFTGKGNIAKAIIGWRRRDQHPDQKRIIIQDAKTGKKLLNVKTADISREEATIFFEPTSGNGIYYIYYMPYIDEGTNTYYPKGVYRKPENTASAQWLTGIAAMGTSPANCLVKEIQSINAFNSFYPMEVIATAAETKKLTGKNSDKAFLVFPESREYSIRMRNDLPQRWNVKGVQNSFTATAPWGVPGFSIRYLCITGFK